jgi:hypothetical protein
MHAKTADYLRKQSISFSNRITNNSNGKVETQVLKVHAEVQMKIDALKE